MPLKKFFETLKKVFWVVKIAKKPSYGEIKRLFKFLIFFSLFIGFLAFLFYFIGILFFR
ncbi:MAG: hypothetical protein QW197_02200 [Candidatus Aenigmatarchaeota archaeon]